MQSASEILTSMEGDTATGFLSAIGKAEPGFGLTPEEIKALRAPFPKEAMSADPVKKYLSAGVNVGWVVERFHTALGPARWFVGYDNVSRFETGVSVRVFLFINGQLASVSPGDGQIVSKSMTYGDAIKSAVSDGFKKACFYSLGMMTDIYKKSSQVGTGSGASSSKQQAAPPAQAPAPPAQPSAPTRTAEEIEQLRLATNVKLRDRAREIGWPESGLTTHIFKTYGLNRATDIDGKQALEIAWYLHFGADKTDPDGSRLEKIKKFFKGEL